MTKQLRVQILQFCTALDTDWQTSRVCFSQNRFNVVLAFLPSLALLCDCGSRPFFFTLRAAYLNTQKQRDCFAVYIGQGAEEIREKEVKNSILPTLLTIVPRVVVAPNIPFCARYQINAVYVP